MKGNICMGRMLKCSGSRMARLILPERKESENNEEKGGGVPMRVAVYECDGVATRRGREQRWRLVVGERKSSRMMEGRGMEEHKHYSRGN